MAGDRIAQALARIEAAASRIEAEAARPVSASAPASADPELSRKYDALRREAGAALADLDRLLGSLGG